MGAATTTVQSAIPVSQYVSVVLSYAVEAGADAVHIEPGNDHVSVRYRVDSILHPSLQLPAGSHQPLVERLRLVSGLPIRSGTRGL